MEDITQQDRITIALIDHIKRLEKDKQVLQNKLDKLSHWDESMKLGGKDERRK